MERQDDREETWLVWLLRDPGPDRPVVGSAQARSGAEARSKVAAVHGDDPTWRRPELTGCERLTALRLTIAQFERRVLDRFAVARGDADHASRGRVSRNDRDGVTAYAPGASSVSPDDGKHRGCGARLRHRAKRTALIGPSRRVVWELEGRGLELLECGHLESKHARRGCVYQRCTGCRDGRRPDTLGGCVMNSDACA